MEKAKISPKVEETLAKLTAILLPEDEHNGFSILYQNNETGTVIIWLRNWSSQAFYAGNPNGHSSTGSFYGPEAAIGFDGIDEDDEKVVLKMHGGLNIHFGIEVTVGNAVFNFADFAPYGKEGKTVKFY